VILEQSKMETVATELVAEQIDLANGNGEDAETKSKKRKLEAKKEQKKEESSENGEKLTKKTKSEADINANSKRMKTKSDKKIFQYGNYDRYYGYRLSAGEKDLRITILKKNWFCSKSCLDIGCNTGKFTMEIAARFLPESIVGIDIDSTLIDKANMFLKTRKEKLELPDFPISFELTLGPISPSIFPNNVSFIAGNYLEVEKQNQI